MYNYDMDYEEAADIAYDSEKYYDYGCGKNWEIIRKIP